MDSMSPAAMRGLEPPDAAHVGEWIQYLRGERFPEDNRPSDGTTWLLGCDCGIAGCWPLEAYVSIGLGHVTWDRFRQPHRPAQDYTNFGPFVFDRAQYEEALADLSDRLRLNSHR